MMESSRSFQRLSCLITLFCWHFQVNGMAFAFISHRGNENRNLLRFTSGVSPSLTDEQLVPHFFRLEQKNRYVGPFDAQQGASLESETPDNEVLKISFQSMKQGGLKVWMSLYFLSAGKRSDLQYPFQVTDISEAKGCPALRLVISENDDPIGVLDVTFSENGIRVTRYEDSRTTPYPGELYAMYYLLEAMLELKSSKDVKEGGQLFTDPENKLDEAFEAVKMDIVKLVQQKSLGMGGQAGKNEISKIGTLEDDSFETLLISGGFILVALVLSFFTSNPQ
mmetsp:Transcript_4926/g.7285  ORF Transcript_4926/g.7285 Transcript_4926/m.7285 type:complete len:280 (-) Transcript_4926:327-1166(-)